MNYESYKHFNNLYKNISGLSVEPQLAARRVILQQIGQSQPGELGHRFGHQRVHLAAASSDHLVTSRPLSI
jgi:hypothetical protein